MLFRRRNKDSKIGPTSRKILRTAPKEYSDYQVFLESHLEEVYRGQIDDTLVLQLESSIVEPVKVRLDDLCIQGASVLVPTPRVPAVKEGEIVGVRIEHLREGWRVLTPGLVRAIQPETRRFVRFGLEFINPGNLYSQMEDRLGLHFNRRAAVRLKTEEKILDCQIRAKAHRLRTQLIDVSVTGLGAWVSHVEAAALRKGEDVHVVLKPLDKREPIEGPARVMRKEPHGLHDVVGLAFLNELWEPEMTERLEEFVHSYLRKRLRWSA